MMTHLDLCTGIGGFHIAAQWAGFQTLGFSEVDPFCSRLLAEKWPLVPNYGDLRTADFSGLRKRVSVFSAGVPCQPSSLAGKRRGAGDDRWLWEAVLDVVGSVQPAWCIFENPPGIVSLGEFGGVLLRLASLGYEVRMFSVPANAVGAKHRRERVFIVANRARELLNGSGNARQGWRNEPTDGGEALADADLRRLEGQRLEEHSAIQCTWWQQSNRCGAGGWRHGPPLADTAGARLPSGRSEQSGEIRNGAWSEEFNRRGYGAEALADTAGGRSASDVQAGQHTTGSEAIVADTDSAGLEKLQSSENGHQCEAVIGGCGPIAVAESESFGVGESRKHSDWRLTEPPLCRRIDGVPDRSHRLKALGNSVVPQQAYPFFVAIRQTIEIYA